MTEGQFSVIDHRHMALALREARRGIATATPNPAVGCVIARGADVIATGWHRMAGEPHAEVVALERAGEAARGAVAYVSLEPCTVDGRTPPCTDALIRAGVARVVYAVDDPNPAVSGGGAERLRAAGIEVASGLMAAAAERLNAGFFKRMRTGRPLTIVKIAASLDGRTAMRSGESRWITDAPARADVQVWRAQACAVMTGIGTVLADDPSLTVRDGRYGPPFRQPLRVVIDSRVRTPVEAGMLALEGETLVLGTAPRVAAETLIAAGASYERLGEIAYGTRPDGVDLAEALDLLGRRGINTLLVEAGPLLVGSLITRRLADRLLLYLAPRLLGSETREMLNTPAWHALADGRAIEVEDMRMVGDDLRVIASFTD
jgi:diaminohydroxyphosphoribosylaminopyrimidine deaminase/5-amino-6-(5-phosphoribosylamino)uracil reductase